MADDSFGPSLPSIYIKLEDSFTNLYNQRKERTLSRLDKELENQIGSRIPYLLPRIKAKELEAVKEESALSLLGMKKSSVILLRFDYYSSYQLFYFIVDLD